jgi:hypothetical protein
MAKSADAKNRNWRREWEDEQTLTPEERKQARREQAEYDRIFEDQLMLVEELKEMEREEERQTYLRQRETLRQDVFGTGFVVADPLYDDNYYDEYVEIFEEQLQLPVKESGDQ